MWPLFLGTDTPAPLMLPDSVQKANFAETVHKIANLDFETVLQNLLSESVWILLKIALALAIYLLSRHPRSLRRFSLTLRTTGDAVLAGTSNLGFALVRWTTGAFYRVSGWRRAFPFLLY